MLTPDNISPIRPANKDDFQVEKTKKIPPVPVRPFKEVLDKHANREGANQVRKKHIRNSEGAAKYVDIDTVADAKDARPSAMSVLSSRQRQEERNMQQDRSKERTPERSSNIVSSTKRENVASPKRAQPVKEDETAAQEGSPSTVAKPVESPFALYKQLTSKEAPESSFALETSSDMPAKPTKAGSRSEKTTTKYQQEEPDLAYVNPLGGAVLGVNGVAESVEDLPKPMVVSHIKEIVEQIVKELQIVERQGQTDTVIILKRPDMFNDARVVLTSFDSATKEFNIAFENLTMAGKQLLDNNLFSLRAALEDKGYANALHIVTTTTIIEHHLPGEEGHASHDEFAGGQQGQQQEHHEESEEQEA